MEATVYSERSIIESPKAKTLANHNGHGQYSEPNAKLLHAADAKRGERRVGRFGFGSTFNWMETVARVS